MGKISMITLPDRASWLENRNKGLGGSEIASVIGLNHFMTNTQLWEYKTGRAEHPDISDKPYVKYGTEAERHLRALFALDHPELMIFYEENNSWTNTDYPWARASLDGWSYDPDGRLGVLEIKTSEIRTSEDWQHWEDKDTKQPRLPESYFCQVLFYMAVIGAEYANLRAAIKYSAADGERRTTIRDYSIERSDVEDDIKYLMQAGEHFWTEYVLKDKRPPLIF